MPFAAKKTTSGTPAKKVAAKKTASPPKITFKAPADMKSCFIELMFKTQADGLIGPSFKANRVRGNWTNPNAKRFDMMTYDAPTVAGMLSRISARTFATNATRRLPANTAFKLVLRAAVRSADGTLAAGVKSIARLATMKSGKKTWKELTDTTDYTRRKLRSCGRFLPGAFVNMQLPPSGRQSKADADEE